MRGTKQLLLFFILNQTIYNSFEQWRAKKQKKCLLLICIFLSFFLFKLNIRTTLKGTDPFLKQNPQFQTLTDEELRVYTRLQNIMQVSQNASGSLLGKDDHVSGKLRGGTRLVARRVLLSVFV